MVERSASNARQDEGACYAPCRAQVVETSVMFAWSLPRRAGFSQPVPVESYGAEQERRGAALGSSMTIGAPIVHDKFDALIMRSALCVFRRSHF